MKNASLKMFVLTIIAILMLQGCAYATEALSTNIASRVDQMKQLFKDRQFDEAYEVALDVEQEIGDFNFKGYAQDALLLISFLKGYHVLTVDEPDEKDLDYAAGQFNSILETGFEDPNGIPIQAYSSYVEGLREQRIENYENAITYYSEALSSGLSLAGSKKQICQELLNEKKYKFAKVYLAGNQYLYAAQLFLELGPYNDSKDRLKECYYRYAEQLENEQKYEEAAAYYMESEGYGSDSMERASQCLSLASAPIPENILSDLQVVETSISSAIITWKDSQNIGKYKISWYPGLMVNKAMSTTSDSTKIELSDLIPSTEYHIIVSLVSNEEERIEANAKTSDADDAYDIGRIWNTELYSCSISALEDWADHRTDWNIITENERATPVVDDTLIELPNGKLWESTTGYVFECTYTRKPTEENQTVQTMGVLRIGDYVSVERRETVISARDASSRFVSNITSLFDDVFEAAGGWPDEHMAVFELYIDGNLFCKKNIALG